MHWEHPDGGADLLARCHTASLDVAAAAAARSVAFPAISCGVYGWSPSDAAPLAVAAVRQWWADHPDTTIQRVRFVVFNVEAERAFTSAVENA
jgi:O-acetyl-ADP-ribose deacetylase (regulator of RNase III)